MSTLTHCFCLSCNNYLADMALFVDTELIRCKFWLCRKASQNLYICVAVWARWLSVTKKKKWWKFTGNAVCGIHMLIRTAPVYVYACTYMHTHGHTLTAHLHMLWAPLLPFLGEGSGSCLSSSRVCWIQGLRAVYDFSRIGPISLFYYTEFSINTFFPPYMQQCVSSSPLIIVHSL